MKKIVVLSLVLIAVLVMGCNPPPPTPACDCATPMTPVATPTPAAVLPTSLPPATEPVAAIVRVPEHLTTTACTGPTSWTYQESIQVIDADQEGRAGREGILDWYLFPNPDELPEGIKEIEFLTGIGGLDPRDGCPYAIELVSGTNVAYVIKKGDGIGGNYSVLPMELHAVPTHIINVDRLDDGVIIRYETKDGGEVSEGIMFGDTMPVG